MHRLTAQFRPQSKTRCADMISDNTKAFSLLAYSFLTKVLKFFQKLVKTIPFQKHFLFRSKLPVFFPFPFRYQHLAVVNFSYFPSAVLLNSIKTLFQISINLQISTKSENFPFQFSLLLVSSIIKHFRISSTRSSFSGNPKIIFFSKGNNSNIVFYNFIFTRNFCFNSGFFKNFLPNFY